MFENEFVQFTLTPILAIVGAVFGSIGTVLGVLNYRLRRKQTTIDLQLTVTPHLRISSGVLEALFLEIKVANTGFTAATVTEFGFVINRKWLGKEKIPFSPAFGNSSRALLPLRIEAQDEQASTRGCGPQDLLNTTDPFPILKKVTAIYAKTASGKYFYAKGVGLNRYIEHAEAREGLRPKTW